MDHRSIRLTEESNYQPLFEMKSSYSIPLLATGILALTFPASAEFNLGKAIQKGIEIHQQRSGQPTPGYPKPITQQGHRPPPVYTPAPVYKPTPKPAPVYKPAPNPAPVYKPTPKPIPSYKPSTKPEPRPAPIDVSKMVTM